MRPLRTGFSATGREVRMKDFKEFEEIVSKMLDEAGPQFAEGGDANAEAVEQSRTRMAETMILLGMYHKWASD